MGASSPSVRDWSGAFCVMKLDEGWRGQILGSDGCWKKRLIRTHRRIYAAFFDHVHVCTSQTIEQQERELNFSIGQSMLLLDKP